MKQLKTRLATGLLSSVMLLSTFGAMGGTVVAHSASENQMLPVGDVGVTLCNDKVSEANKKKLQSFVTRLYKVCLGRKPDKAGLDSWVEKLSSKEQTGVAVAYGFVFSNEFQSKNVTDEEYVQYMYQAFFDRKADAEGLKTWTDLMGTGWTREMVFEGFANSAEFSKLCDNFGVVRGSYSLQYDWQQQAQVNLFVDRLYTTVLNRSCDAAGIESWTNLLMSKQFTGADVAYGVIFSKEFTDRHFCNGCYVETLYQALMGRNVDQGGYTYWKNKLESGVSRFDVFCGLITSAEFNNICSTYGITAGTIANGSDVPVSDPDGYRCTRCGQNYFVKDDGNAVAPTGNIYKGSVDLTSAMFDEYNWPRILELSPLLIDYNLYLPYDRDESAYLVIWQADASNSLIDFFYTNRKAIIYLEKTITYEVEARNLGMSVSELNKFLMEGLREEFDTETTDPLIYIECKFDYNPDTRKVTLICDEGNIYGKVTKGGTIILDLSTNSETELISGTETLSLKNTGKNYSKVEYRDDAN